MGIAEKFSRYTPDQDYTRLAAFITVFKLLQVTSLILLLGLVSKAAHDEGRLTGTHLAHGFVAQIMGLVSWANPKLE